MGVSQPLRLVVDLRVHAEELRRFEQNIVRGPGAQDCAIWCSAIGADGYGLLGAPRRDADDGAGQPVCARGGAERQGFGAVGAGTARLLVYSRSMTTRVSRPLLVCRTARISGCLSLDGGYGSRVIS